MLRRRVTGTAIGVVLVGTALPAAAAAQTTDECSAPGPLGKVTCVYDNPASAHLLRVPAGVTEVYIDARGAAGGRGGAVNSRRQPPAGGTGGLVAASFPVQSGDLLRILVGGRGHDAVGMKPGAGGRNGGARGGAGTPAGGGGGGASSVRLRGSDEASRILVAGGGGGAGGAVTAAEVSSAGGGAGGGDRGQDGSGDRFGPGGIGAIGPSGGAGLMRITGLDGHSGYDEQWGGEGGEGGYGGWQSFLHSGNWSGGPVGAGGGGGGYAGGSGGAAGPTLGGGGGGGSGFVATSVLAPSVARLGTAELLTGKGSTGNGLVVISYRLPTGPPVQSGATVTPAGTAAAPPAKRD